MFFSDDDENLAGSEEAIDADLNEEETADEEAWEDDSEDEDGESEEE